MTLTIDPYVYAKLNSAIIKNKVFECLLHIC